jgi:threonylcarbamoyladenosine tRNA methylthiotransferase MtaB
MGKLDVITFGCRLNAYESEVIRREAAAAGLADAVIINTCAVTAEATRQARQAIRKARRDNPHARIVVTGCAAQLEPARFAAMAEVDLVLGNAEKLSAASYRGFGLATQEKVRVNDIMAVRETAAHMIDAFTGRTRAFLQVQNGCDHRCTFCVIPYARGPSRSVPLGAAVDQARRLVEGGHAEIVLTGVDITAYGADLPGRPSLGSLARAVLRQVPELKRLRLSSIDSIEADEALMAAFAEEERLMPHVHLSLQSGDDMILKRMKRRHSRGQAVAFCKSLRRLRPDMAFGADLIAGFPTETDEMFANSLAIVEECGLSFLHVFPFSAREGTPAARMPQLPRALVKQRAARLRAEGARALARHLEAQRGATHPVLFETGQTGRTPQFTQVEIEGSVGGEVAAGTIAAVTIAGRRDGALLGRLAR